MGKLLAQDTRQKFFAKGNKTTGTKMSIYALELQPKLSATREVPEAAITVACCRERRGGVVFPYRKLWYVVEKGTTSAKIQRHLPMISFSILFLFFYYAIESA